MRTAAILRRTTAAAVVPPIRAARRRRGAPPTVAPSVVAAAAARAATPYRVCSYSSSSSPSPSPSSGDLDDDPPSRASPSVLFLSPALWPEPSSSAAGVRTSALLRRFADADADASAAAAAASRRSGGATTEPSLFDSVHFGCGAPRPPPSSPAGVRLEELESSSSAGGRIRTHSFPLNRTAAIEAALSSEELAGVKCVVFDRYYAEEAYSFHVKRVRPDALRVLDMQDFHALRLGRMEAVRRWDGRSDEAGDRDGATTTTTTMMSEELMDDIVRHVPSHLGPRADDDEETRGRAKVRDVLLRELASVHRSDLTLVCSPRERSLLADAFGVDPSKLCLAPFFASEHPPAYAVPAEEQFDSTRRDFAVLGGFRHPPNVDSVLWLKREVWPTIRSRLPDATVHVWGSYPPRRVMELHDERTGFLVRGRLDDLEGELTRRKVLLAPLRYGAGIKGKVVDAFRCGLPVVTTPVGAEGTTRSPFLLSGGGDGGKGGRSDADALKSMTVTSGGDDDRTIDDRGWGGLVASTPSALASCATALYTDRSLWSECQRNGRRLLRTLFDRERNLRKVEEAVREAMEDLEERRTRDVAGAVLWHQRNRSSEYFSRWIELKETAGG